MIQDLPDRWSLLDDHTVWHFKGKCWNSFVLTWIWCCHWFNRRFCPKEGNVVLVWHLPKSVIDSVYQFQSCSVDLFVNCIPKLKTTDTYKYKWSLLSFHKTHLKVGNQLSSWQCHNVVVAVIQKWGFVMEWKGGLFNGQWCCQPCWVRSI